MPAELLDGDPAPDFQAVAVGGDYPPEGQTVRLADLRGRRVVLFFYPQNDTPGCTLQACAIRDAWNDLRERAAVFGVNHDTPEGHRRTIEKLALPFPLLSDENHRIARAYGLWLDDGGGGDAEGGESTERATFILDAGGRVEAVLRRVDPAKHAWWLLWVLSH